MKSQLVRGIVGSAFFLAPMLSLAADQPQTCAPAKDDQQQQNNTQVTQAVQPGKGSAANRNQRVKANAYRERIDEDQVALDQPLPGHGYLSDFAYRK